MILQSMRFLVIGLGESGLAMARWLHRQGAYVRVADSREHPPGLQALKAEMPMLECHTGPFTSTLFQGVEAVALSPGVAPSALDAFLPPGLPVVSEITLFVEGVKACLPQTRILGVTGSNGKTTTTALTAHLLNQAGVKAVACGNISPSVLDALMTALDRGEAPAVWVVELSSFQLETTASVGASGAVVLNVTEDHLDRHHTLSEYAAAKARIFSGKPPAVRILNRDDDWSLAMGGCGTGLITFGLNPPPKAGHYGLRDGCLCYGQTPLLALEALPLKGLHNAANVMAALALCSVVGVPPVKAVSGLASFRGLPHRVEPVAEWQGVLYVDDSKGTNVGATLAAIQGMGRPVAIVLGGEGKGQDFAPLLPALQAHGRAVALIGRDKHQIAAALQDAGLPMAFFDSMAAAVRWLAEQVLPGDCVLLSPACASLDMYSGYAERAAVFVQAVRDLQAPEAGGRMKGGAV